MEFLQVNWELLRYHLEGKLKSVNLYRRSKNKWIGCEIYYIGRHSRGEKLQFYPQMLSKLRNNFAPPLTYVGILQGISAT